MTTTIPAGWLPIESAPKDGTPVLLFARLAGVNIATNSPYSPTIHVGAYRTDLRLWTGSAYRDQREIELEPTHWMPRPAFPDCAALASTPVAPTTDRAMLKSVLQELEKSESVCPRCGYGDSCADMDVAHMIRDHLKGDASAPVAVLTDDEFREVIHNAIGFEFAPDELQPVNADDLMNVARALLSKVSAPIADSTLPLEQALHELIDKIVPGLDTGDFVQDARRASTALSAILASAPVAGEATDRIEQMAATRYRVVPDGMCRYKVVAGDGKRALYTDSKDFCLRVAAELTGAFLDGAFVASNAAPQASAEPQQYTHDEVFGPMESAWNAALEQAAAVAKRISDKYAFGHYGNETDTADEIEREILALKQPQADKDGGQQGAGDAERWRWATATDESAQMLYTIVQAYGGDQKKINERADFYRAALSAPQAEQGERDA